MRLLITGAWSGAKVHMEALREMGHEIVFMQQENEQLPCDPGWVEGVICNGLFLQHPIEQFESLKYIQLTSAGFDRIPMDYVKARGIETHNAKGVYSIPMAEFAVAGVLQLYKQSRLFYSAQQRHRWEKHRGLLELAGRTVCIVGCGDVGTQCAKRFQAFGCSVIGVNRTAGAYMGFDRVLTLAQLDTVLPEADVVIFSIALSEETRHLMDCRRFSLLKPSAIVVNISRGEIVDTEALIEAIPGIGGAVLDVFEEEPLGEDSPLWDMETVIITPHNSFVGDQNENRMWDVIKGELNR